MASPTAHVTLVTVLLTSDLKSRKVNTILITLSSLKKTNTTVVSLVNIFKSNLIIMI